jgi:hypothetical protein
VTTLNPSNLRHAVEAILKFEKLFADSKLNFRVATNNHTGAALANPYAD